MASEARWMQIDDGANPLFRSLNLIILVLAESESPRELGLLEQIPVSLELKADYDRLKIESTITLSSCSNNVQRTPKCAPSRVEAGSRCIRTQAARTRRGIFSNMSCAKLYHLKQSIEPSSEIAKHQSKAETWKLRRQISGDKCNASTLQGAREGRTVPGATIVSFYNP